MDDDSGTPVGGTPAAAPAAAAPAAAAPAAAAPAAATAATAAGDDSAPKGLGDWATVRSEYAKGDEKVLKRLERYSSPQAVIDALIAAQNKIASGSLKTALPDKPTPEQLTEWRKENGIPEKPSDYDVKLPDEVAQSESDKATVEAFLKKAHETNMNPAQVKETLNWFFQDQQRQADEQRQAEAVQKEANIEELRREWGSEYKLNLNLVDNFLATAPEGLADQLLGARLADGTPLANDVKTLRWLANVAREINPTATVVPGSGTGAMDAIASEKAALEKKMGDRSSDYWKGPTAEAQQKRYRELIDVELKVKGR